jgi:DNA-binding NtrC family response regulator
MALGLTEVVRPELARLYEVLAHLPSSGSRLCIVEAARGSGKRDLVEELAVRARAEGALVLSGYCTSGQPFAPFAPIVERALTCLSPAETRTLPIGDLACADGCHALWFEHREGPARPHATTPKERLGFHAAMHAIFEAVARSRSVVLSIGGLGAADRETVALIESMLALDETPISGKRARVMIVATLDSEQPNGAIASLLEHPRTLRLALGPLDENGILRLLQRPGVLGRLLERTRGSQAAIERLLSASPPTEEQHADALIAELSPAALTLARSLAVLACPSTRADVARVANTSAAPLDFAELVSSGLARTADEGRIEIESPVARARLLSGLSDGELRRLESAASCSFEQKGELARALAHAISAGDTERAVRLAVPAAQMLAAQQGQAEALDLLERVLVLVADPAPTELLAELADLRIACGEFHRAVAPARTVLERALVAGLETLEAAERLARAYVLSGERGAAARAVTEYFQRTHGTLAPDARIGFESILAELHYQAGDLDRAERHARVAIDSASIRGAGRVLDAFQTLAKVELARGNIDRAVERYAAYEDVAKVAGDTRHQGLAAGGRGVALLTKGDVRSAATHLERCAKLAEATKDRKGQALAAHNLAVVAHLRQSWVEARERYEGALRLLRLVGNRTSLARCAFNLGELYETLGAAKLARAMCELGSQAGGTSLSPRAAADGLLLRGRIAFAAEQWEAARTAFAGASDIFAKVDPVRGVSALAGLARTAARDGKLDEARALLAGVPHDLPPVRDAEIAIATAEIDRTVERWTIAVELAERASDDRLAVEALIGLAEAELARGEGAQATLERAAKRDAAFGASVPADLRADWDDRPLRRRLLALSTSGRPSVPAPRSFVAGAQYRGIVGQSRVMRELFERIDRVGASDCSVLLMGESGTGKELVARALHDQSPRADGPLVCVNSGAIVDELLLSELFGHERGAFTGAHARKRGRFEIAHGGTLFLDEIGDVSPRVQAALLRVLQEKCFERVGGRETISADVRIIAATNRDIEAMVAAGTFREDLYYRLRAIVVELAPLRARRDDVPALARHFVEKVARERSEEPKQLSADAMRELVHYDWPGNVRQLENVIRAATLFADGGVIEVKDLELTSHSALGSHALAAHARAEVAGPAAPAGDEAERCYDRIRAGDLTLRDLKKELERYCVERALEETSGNISQAAHLLGLKRPRMSQLVKEFAIRANGEER